MLKLWKRLLCLRLKINLTNNTIINEFESLVDASNNNKDNLNYQQILNKCLGYSINDKLNFWCYKEDYESNNLKFYEKKEIKPINDFNNETLNKIYDEYKNTDISIRELSIKYSINFSTLNEYIKKHNIPTNNDFSFSNEYILICKKTNKKFTDYLNKSGCITNHILKTYPQIKIESKFKRKQIELTSGKPWYYNYFEFIKK
jgi:hypothetical protein